MKRILLFLLIAISSVITSCENIGVDADAMPVTLEIFVKDDKSVIALVRYDYSDMDGYIGSYVTYVKAEPVK